MIFQETRLSGAYVIELEQKKDERGFFARSFCRQEFLQNGIECNIAQCSFSFNEKKGTLRGMHYQGTPHEEAKIVSCTKGSIYDVIIDLRKDSATYRHWYAIELTDKEHKMLYVPKGFAHGFQTLCDGAEVFYQISEFYYPQSALGVRWNDKVFNIKWPLPVSMISQRDNAYEDFN